MIIIPAPKHSKADNHILLVVDVRSNRHPISPYIYGLNEASPETLHNFNIKLNRWGGNRATTYNWKEDTTSTAADWYFQNLKSNRDRKPEEWKYKDYDLFIQGNKQSGADSLITVPMIGWVSKDAESKSFSVAKYGPQHSVAPEDKDAGDGLKPDDSPVVNDPNDSSVPANVDFQRDWIKQIVESYGPASRSRVRFYSLDNEPSLWHEIHRDMHPKPAGYDEILSLSKQYAVMIKSVDPEALVTGPVLSHWSSYFNSAQDNFELGADRKAHGGVGFLEWYLREMQRAEKESGHRLLDYLDVHFYPETRAGKDRQRIVLDSEEEGDADIQAARLRSTRALWDSTYDDESWIKQPVRLIPFLKEIVARNYPGTKIAITEYRWGPYGSMSSALAEADVLGIFGREGLDMAAFWNGGSKRFIGSPTEFAFRCYLNYDGHGASFGDISVTANSTDQESVSIYAAIDSKTNDLTAIAINKSLQTLQPAVELRGYSGRLKEVFRYSAANPAEILRLANSGTPLEQISRVGFPAKSITILRFSTS